MNLGQTLFEVLNGLSGKSVLFDQIFAAVATNDLLKAGMIGACLIAAWSAGKTVVDSARIRRRLLLVLVAAACTVATTKVLGKWIAYPRPFVLSQEQVYRFQDGQLTAYDRTPYRAALASDSQKRLTEMRTGFIDGNDWESFPSDHAGFFGCLALGLLWAYPPAGWVALGWTLLVILPGKLVRGLHRPADIFAGLALAVAILLVWQQLDRLKLLDRFGQLTVRWNAVATGLFFAAAMEVACTLEHAQDAALAARDILRALMA